MRKQSALHLYQAQFENYVALTTTQSTSRRYALALENFFRRFSEKREPDEFTRRDIQDYQIYRMRDKVSPSTVNYEVQVVSSFWNWLMRQDIVSYNPVTTSKRLKQREPERKSLSEEEQVRLYQTVEAMGSLHARLLVSLSLATGLRAQTLVQLDNTDIDFERSCIRVPAVKMKAGRNHEIPIRPGLIDLLKQLPEGRLFEGYADNAKKLSYRFSRLLHRAGIKLNGLRTGRRTFATTLLRTGTDIGIVKDLMGHKSVLTTSKYITQADSAQVKAAIDRLPGGASG